MNSKMIRVTTDVQMVVTYVHEYSQSIRMCIVSGHLVRFAVGSYNEWYYSCFCWHIHLYWHEVRKEEMVTLRLSSMIKKKTTTSKPFPNPPPDDLLAALSQIWHTVVGVAGNWRYQISISIHPLLHQADQNNWENGKQRKVTAVILGSLLALCAGVS